MKKTLIFALPAVVALGIISFPRHSVLEKTVKPIPTPAFCCSPEPTIPPTKGGGV